MIAEIYGKISSTGSNLSDRLEDQLTGDVFGSLRYLDATAALFPFLEKSYYLNDIGHRSNFPSFKNGKVKEIQFWPRIDEVEPDIQLLLEFEGQERCVIFIEVKYSSGLSSDDPTESHVLKGECSLMSTDLWQNDRSSIEESRNQLVRQMRGMREIYHGLRQIQIFLTADRIYPADIIFRVRQLANLEGFSDTELYWLSWHDLPAVLLRSCEDEGQLSDREKLIIFDVLRLCERKGFARFSRIEFDGGAVPNACKQILQAMPNEAPDRIPIRIFSIPSMRPAFISIASNSLPAERPTILEKEQDG